MAEITIRNLTKKFGKFAAIDGLDLTIADKEFVSLLGPSGCGKTTTLRILSGLEEPTFGDVLFDGQVMSSAETGEWVPPEKRGIGLVFQSYALWPHMTVRENIEFGLEMQRIPKEDRKKLIDDILVLLQIETLGKRYSYQLSGGQQQRVALARSIVLHPEVLLLDEPLSNLDARLRIEMRAELTRLHSQLQNTTVFVTHDQLEAMTLSTRVAVMNEGKLQQYAPPMEIYTAPTNLFVAKFVGNPPINVITRSTSGKLFSPVDTLLKDRVHGGIEFIAFRPEFVRLTSTSSDVAKGSYHLDVTVTSIQPTGPEWIVQVGYEEHRFLLRLERAPSQMAIGDLVRIQVDASDILAYDGDEQLITARNRV